MYNWGGAMFVSGSHDRTIRFWDLRTRGCVNVVTPNTSLASRVSSVYSYDTVTFPDGKIIYNNAKLLLITTLNGHIIAASCLGCVLKLS